MSAELVACTLGARERPELRTDPATQLRLVMEGMRQRWDEHLRRLRPQLDRVAEQLRRHVPPAA